MGPGGIIVVLAMYWLTGGVGAASLSPDDQYFPYQSPHRTDAVQVPLSYPNWLKYQPDLTTRLEAPDYTSGSRRADVNYVSEDRATLEDSIIPDLDILPFIPGKWNFTSSTDLRRNPTESGTKNFRTLEVSKSVPTSNDEDFTEEDTFQDQGPGSVEVYNLDLHRETSLLVPHVADEQIGKQSRTKSKAPKKAKVEEILWKLKPIDAKSQLPAIFHELPQRVKDSKLSRESNRKAKNSRDDEVFTVGGVPELQVGCEGLEASKRKKRSKGSDVEDTDSSDDWDNSEKYQDPVYRESTEPILLRVTPIVLENDDDEPPSGEVYEEMDALMKLKELETTSPKPTTRRWNRADIDPALEMYKHKEEHEGIETFPERGDLGPTSNSSSSEVGKSMDQEVQSRSTLEKERFQRDTVSVDSSASFATNLESNKDTSRSSLSQAESTNHRNGRKILWVQYSDRQEIDKPTTSSKYNQASRGHPEDSDLWGFAEEDGDLSDTEDEPDLDKLREAEAEKRRREFERRRQEELYRRQGGMRDGHQTYPESDTSKGRNVNTEIEKIREEYERQLEKQQRERQSVSQRKSEWERKHGGGIDQQRVEEMRRRQENESRRRSQEEERRRNWNRIREEEERRRRLGNQQSYTDPPSPLTRIGSPTDRNAARDQQDNENEERKLRDYIERNRPINPKKAENRQRLDGEVVDNDSHRKHMEYQERRRIEDERRHQQLEEHRRRQKPPTEAERQRQMEEDRRRNHRTDRLEEHRRRQHELHENERRRQMEDQQRQRDSDERRRQIEEQRKRDRPDSRRMEEEERQRRLEEEKKLQDYVRRNQPVIVPKKNNSQTSNISQESNLEEQRRTIEAARQWDRSRRPIVNPNDGRMHGPSAPTNTGQRYGQDDQEDMRRKQERLEEDQRRESNRRRMEEEERRREAEYRRVESRRREEERKRLEDAARRVEESRRAQSAVRTNPWQENGSSHRPAGQVPDRDAEELRRRESAGRTTSNAMRNQELEWRRRSEERAQQQQEQEREKQRLENERNSRNNRHRRPHNEDNRQKPRQRSESVRGGYNEAEWRRREHARLNSLPVSARIIVRSDGPSRNGGRTPSQATPSTPQHPFIPSIGTRGSFDNDVDFPVLTPNRPGVVAQRFPAPATLRPPVESPGACVWAIVQCCPSNNRRTACFESMGCPGAVWDPSPCRSALADAAREEIVKFYAAADRRNTRN